jgi:hypothetical protein
MKLLCNALAALVVILASGCAAKYTTPGAGMSVGDLSQAEPDIADLMKAEPAARFPARIAVVRLQAAGYSSRTSSCYGEGRYCVVTTRDIEPEDSYAQLAKLPQVAGFGPLNRLILPSRFSSTRELRQSAARLRADMLLVYSIDTAFRIDSTDVGPLGLITLGFLPTKNARVTATASAVMFDVRTGFIYGLAEATAVEEQRGTYWSSEAAVDSARQAAESQAFQKLVGEIRGFWDDVLKTHSAKKL